MGHFETQNVPNGTFHKLSVTQRVTAVAGWFTATAPARGPQAYALSPCKSSPQCMVASRCSRSRTSLGFVG